MLVERLCRQSGLTPSQIEHYAATASRRYKVFPIKKRDGTDRMIAQPSKPIKSLQRWLSRVIFRQFPVHAASTAYSKGSSIRANAAAHRNSNYTIRIDFEAFFPSFSGGDVERFLQSMNEKLALGLSGADIEFARRIVCRDDVLTIGAPSSPILTNAMMYEFDLALAGWAGMGGVVYTRYADDVFLSAASPDALKGAEEVVRRLGRAHPYATLRVNRSKTAFLTRKRRRIITGLVITSDRRVSLGRERKRKIKTLVYRFMIGESDEMTTQYLRGMLAFARDAEPSFYEGLARKFGGSVLDAIEGRYPATQKVFS